MYFLKEQVVNEDNYSNTIVTFSDKCNFFIIVELEEKLDRKRKPSAGGNHVVTYENVRATQVFPKYHF